MKFVATSNFWIAGEKTIAKGEVVSFEDEGLIGELRAAGRLADFGSEQAIKIQAEVIAEQNREKHDMHHAKEPWTRAHRLTVISTIVGIILAISGWGFAAWLALGRGNQQSHSTEAMQLKTNSVLQTNK